MDQVPTKTKASRTIDRRFLVGSPLDEGINDGGTPLILEKGHLEVVRFLVECGANKDRGKTE